MAAVLEQSGQQLESMEWMVNFGQMIDFGRKA
jgi:hypothetical protein